MSAEDEGEAKATVRRPSPRRRAAPVIEGEARIVEEAAQAPDNRNEEPAEAAPATDPSPVAAASAGMISDGKTEDVKIDQARSDEAGSSRRLPLSALLAGGIAGALASALSLLFLLPVLVGSSSGSGNEETVQRLKSAEQRLGAVEGRSAGAAAAGDVARLSHELSALRQAVGALETRLAAVQVPSASAGGSREEVASLRQNLAALEQKLVALPDAGRIEGDVASLRRELAARPASGGEPAALLLVAVELLRQAFERGDPFARELEVARGLGLEATTADRLGLQAASGLPTARQLGERFSERAAAMLDSLRVKPETLGDHALQLLGRVVRIRPVGETPGADPGAVIARIEARLKRNDAAGALGEAAALPAPARQVAEPVLAQLSERVELERVMGGLVGELIKALPRKG